MKQNLERLFKESLDNYEMPFENGAWEQLSKRLDGSPSTPFYRKWWFAASLGTVLVSSAVYFGLSGKEQAADPVKETLVAAQTEQTAPAGSDLHNENVSGRYTEPQIGSTPEDVVVHMVPGDNADPIKTTTPFGVIDPEPNDIEPVVNPGNQERFLAPELPKTVCVNSPVSFVNPNEKGTITVVMPNGNKHSVKPKEKFSFASSKAGNVQVISGSHTDYIAVEESATNLYIDVDPVLVYDKGVPLLTFKASGTELKVHWSSSVNAQRDKGSELEVYPFVEKTVTATAEVTDQNGCTVKKETTVRLDQQYNLLASTGFNPLSNDARNNRFMPFALTQRDTPFELTIMDPNTQTVIFRSSDASIGWDGTGRNGDLVPLNSTWLWRVVMKNPLPGEPKEYKGLITYQDR